MREPSLSAVPVRKMPKNTAHSEQGHRMIRSRRNSSLRLGTAILVGALGLAACGSDAASDAADSSAGDEATGGKVAVAYDLGGRGDGGFNDLAYAGAVVAAEKEELEQNIAEVNQKIAEVSAAADRAEAAADKMAAEASKMEAAADRMEAAAKRGGGAAAEQERNKKKPRHSVHGQKEEDEERCKWRS